MTETAVRDETLPVFLRRGAVIVAVLTALVGAAVYLTARDDEQTARELCTTAARAQFGGAAVVVGVDRTGDDRFVVQGSAGGRSFTCGVVRQPLTDAWEVDGVR